MATPERKRQDMDNCVSSAKLVFYWITIGILSILGYLLLYPVIDAAIPTLTRGEPGFKDFLWIMLWGLTFGLWLVVSYIIGAIGHKAMINDSGDVEFMRLIPIFRKDK